MESEGYHKSHWGLYLHGTSPLKELSTYMAFWVYLAWTEDILVSVFNVWFYNENFNPATK